MHAIPSVHRRHPVPAFNLHDYQKHGARMHTLFESRARGLENLHVSDYGSGEKFKSNYEQGRST